MKKKLFDRQTEKVLTITLKRVFWILWIVIGIFLYKDSFVNNRIMQEVRTIRQADTVCIVLSDNKKSTAALPNNADDYEFTMRYRHVDSPCQVATLHFSREKIFSLRHPRHHQIPVLFSAGIHFRDCVGHLLPHALICPR